MSYQRLLESQMFRRKSPNLAKIGFNFDSENLESEYIAIQNLLYRLYHIKMESMLTIMKMFGIPSSRTMDILFGIFDIEARSFSDAASNSFIENRNSPNDGWSAKSIWHTAFDGTKHFLRSSYELDFAKKLDKDNIKYEVENFRFKYFDSVKNKFRIAIPDFYIPSRNLIVEIKSRYWLDESNMECKKKAYENLGFKFLLIVEKEEIDLSNFTSVARDSNPEPIP